MILNALFKGVKVIVESLPRTESSLLSVKLSTLFLRDLTTQGTIFPVLVSPKTVSSDQEPHVGHLVSER